MLEYVVLGLISLWLFGLFLVLRRSINRVTLAKLSYGYIAIVFLTYHLCKFDRDFVIPMNYCYALFLEDKLFEWLTAICLMFAGGLLIASRQLEDTYRVRQLKFSGGLILLILFLEEISWGQRIIMWETPSVLKEINSQSETNLHNINSSLTGLLQQFGYLILGVVCFLLSVFRQIKLCSFAVIQTLTPPRDFAVFGIVLVILSIHSGLFGHEPGEIIFAVICINYSTFLWLRKFT